MMRQGLVRWLVAGWNFQLANAAILAGRRDAAVAAYRRVLQRWPDHNNARMVLGNLLAEGSDELAALDQFRRVVEHDTRHADAWFNLGFLHEKRGELVPAETCLRQALDCKPRHDRAWYGLGLVLVRSGRLEDAVLAFQRNVKLQPFSPDGYCQLALSLQGLGRAEAAQKVLRHLQSFEPRYAVSLARELESAPPAWSDPFPLPISQGTQRAAQ